MKIISEDKDCVTLTFGVAQRTQWIILQVTNLTLSRIYLRMLIQMV